ncbi:MAG: AI-2E family transporter [Alistipes sp.]|nr:AI-2E family transporter [Alistipes sp.]
MAITPQGIMRFTVGALLTAAILFLVWYFSAVVIYILVAAVLAIMGRPLVNWLSRQHIGKFLMPRWVAATITLIVIAVIFTSVFSLFIPLVFNKINEFAHLDFKQVLASVEEPISHAQTYLQRTFALPETQFSLSDTLISSLKEFINYNTLNSTFTSIINIALSTLISVFSIAFITFFFLKEDGLFYSMVTAMFPDRLQANVTRALDSISVLLARYFTGIFTESLILMVIISTIMILFGMKTDNALLIGLVMGVMNVIPYAGPLMGGILSAFIGIVTPIAGYTATHTAMIICITLFCIKGFDDFVLQPTIYSERVKAHPLEIFLVILIAGYMAGILGMLFAIPSYTVLRVLAKEFFSEFSLVQKLTQNI